MSALERKWAYDGPEGIDPRALVVDFTPEEAAKLPGRGLDGVARGAVLVVDAGGNAWLAERADCGGDQCFCALRLIPAEAAS
jgi:hypothetical protein